jgi:hypothetical protein
MAEHSMLALSVAFSHPVLSTDPKVLCAAACACKAWRAAVPQCGACNTVIKIKPEATLQRLCSFAQWFAKHAPLVKSITANCHHHLPNDSVHGLPWDQHVTAAQQLLQQALQLAAAWAALQTTAAACTPAAAPPQQQQLQQQHGLHMSSFSSNCLVRADLLAALPAHSLTHLELEFMHSTAPDSAALSAVLAQLSSLKHLELSSGNNNSPVSGRCLLGLSQLHQLTRLKLVGFWSDSEQPLQQLLAQPLALRHLHLDWQNSAQDLLPELNMAALKQLEELVCENELAEGSVLPSQLQQLQLTPYLGVTAGSLSPVTQLQQLRRIYLFVRVKEQEPLLRLAQLPALQHLAFDYCENYAAAAATAAAWLRLPQLCELQIGGADDSPNRVEMEAILAGIAASTQLTKLNLEVQANLREDGGVAEDVFIVAACARVARLLHLKDLYLSFDENESLRLGVGDALALTALTGLTRLSLCIGRSALGDYEATALACNLQQLRDLDLLHQ